MEYRPDTRQGAVEDRNVSMGDGLAALPERLLLAQARGQVLFICGAGISMPAGLPDFSQLVLDVYAALDSLVHSVLLGLPRDAGKEWRDNNSQLNPGQQAEIRRFIQGDYDVALGMLERRLDNETQHDSQVRGAVANRLRAKSTVAPIHRTLLRLADRGGSTAIVTTNFDLLLEGAGRRNKPRIETYSLGAIPRPSVRSDFVGILHIHGALSANSDRLSELVLSDQDFGEFYLRRRVVPDFIYDAARLYHLVLVGYSANDPPMRYLLNAVAADGTRFGDLKERYAFVGAQEHDPIALQDWRARGITPIHYDSQNSHAALYATLQRWAQLSPICGKRSTIDREVRRIVKTPRSVATDADRDLFDHVVRRSNPSERSQFSALASEAKAEVGWLDAIIEISAESSREAQQ